jgi:hypothetical protein
MKKLSQVLFPSMYAKMSVLRDENIEMNESLVNIATERRKFGEHLKEEAFLPEDLKFEATDHKDPKGRSIEIYTKDGWTLSPHLYSPVANEWSIMNPEREIVKVIIDDLYGGIELLRMMRMEGISIDAFMAIEE